MERKEKWLEFLKDFEIQEERKDLIIEYADQDLKFRTEGPLAWAGIDMPLQKSFADNSLLLSMSIRILNKIKDFEKIELVSTPAFIYEKNNEDSPPMVVATYQVTLDYPNKGLLLHAETITNELASLVIEENVKKINELSEGADKVFIYQLLSQVIVIDDPNLPVSRFSFQNRLARKKKTEEVFS